MNKIILEIAEENIVDLEIAIHNDSVTINESDVSVKMVIEGDNNLNYSFDAHMDNGSYVVSIPRLKNTFPVGERDCYVEVVCYDRYFKPWQGKVQLKEQTRVVVKAKNKTAIVEDTKIQAAPVARTKKPVVKKRAVKKKDDLVFEIVMDKQFRKSTATRKVGKRRQKINR